MLSFIVLLYFIIGCFVFYHANKNESIYDNDPEDYCLLGLMLLIVVSCWPFILFLYFLGRGYLLLIGKINKKLGK